MTISAKLLCFGIRLSLLYRHIKETGLMAALFLRIKFVKLLL